MIISLRTTCQQSTQIWYTSKRWSSLAFIINGIGIGVTFQLLLKRRGLNFNFFLFPTIFSALNSTHRAILGNVSQGISGTHVLYGKGKYWHQRTEHCCFTKAQIFQPFGCFLFEHFFVYKYSFKLYFYEIRIILSRLFCWIDRTW